MGEGHGGALDFFTWELQIPYMGEEEVKNLFIYLFISHAMSTSAHSGLYSFPCFV